MTMSSPDIRTLFQAYWAALERSADWVDLGMGMPLPATLGHSLVLQRALRQGITERHHYAPPAGSLAVRRQLAAYETARTGVPHCADNIMVVAGAIRGYSLVIDQYIAPTTTLLEVVPTYPLLAGQLRTAAERWQNPVITLTPQDRQAFRVAPADLLPYLTPGALLTLVNPNNPTGIYIPAATLDRLVAAAEEVGALIVIDESCDLPLQTRPRHPQRLSPAVVRIVGLSKDALLAGYRIGYLVATADRIATLAHRYTFSDANAPTVVNAALVDWVNAAAEREQVNAQVRTLVAQALRQIQGMAGIDQIIVPEACYYLYLKAKRAISSWQFFEEALAEGVNILPGALFGMATEGAWVRLCCARPRQELTAGLRRLQRVFEKR